MDGFFAIGECAVTGGLPTWTSVDRLHSTVVISKQSQVFMLKFGEKQSIKIASAI